MRSGHRGGRAAESDGVHLTVIEVNLPDLSSDAVGRVLFPLAFRSTVRARWNHRLAPPPGLAPRLEAHARLRGRPVRGHDTRSHGCYVIVATTEPNHPQYGNTHYGMLPKGLECAGLNATPSRARSGRLPPGGRYPVLARASQLVEAVVRHAFCGRWNRPRIHRTRPAVCRQSPACRSLHV